MSDNSGNSSHGSGCPTHDVNGRRLSTSKIVRSVYMDPHSDLLPTMGRKMSRPEPLLDMQEESPQRLPNEDYTFLDGFFKVFAGTLRPIQPQCTRTVFETFCNSAEEAKGVEATELGQRLFDADLFWCETTSIYALLGNEDIIFLTADALAHPKAPKFSMTMFFFLKRDASLCGSELLVRGVHTCSKAHGIISSKDFILYLFRSESSARPRRALLLKTVSQVSASEAGGQPIIHIDIDDAGKKEALELVMPDWDVAQTWMGTLTSPAVLFAKSATGNLRGARQQLMRQRSPLPADYDAVVEEAKRMEGAVIRQKEVSLRDVLDTPHFRLVLTRFMQRNYCEESMNFLLAVFSYQQLFTDNPSMAGPMDAMDAEALAHVVAPTQELQERRAKAAYSIFNEFLSADSPSMVNVDSYTFDLVKQRMDKTDFSLHLFDEAHTNIFSMVEHDVYQRFQASSMYRNMIEHPLEMHAAALGPTHRKSPSFALVATEEDTAWLTKLAQRFSEESEAVKSRRYHLVKYYDCFKGAQFVDWLQTNHLVTNRLAGISIGQRMLDACILAHVTDEHDFEDSMDIFYTLRKREGKAGPTPAEVIRHAGRSYVFASELLLKGVRYLRVFALISKKDRLLYLYRDRVAVRPIRQVSLRGASCEVVSTGSSLSYLNLDLVNPSRSLVFRVEDALILKGWIAALISSHISLRSVCDERHHVRRSSF